MIYKVEPTKINKSICVSYDESNGDISPAVSTTIDRSSSQITCTFYKNSDLYYDSDCQFIDESACSTKDSAFNDSVT